MSKKLPLIVLSWCFCCCFPFFSMAQEVGQGRIVDDCDNLIIIVRSYIKDIAEKNYSKNDRSIFIGQVLRHFKDSATIQVSNINSTVVATLKAREYFRRLRDLDYDEVLVSFETNDSSKGLKSTYVEKTDGENNYIISGRYVQTFEGYSKARDYCYGDVTIKKIYIEAIKKNPPYGKPAYYQIKVRKIEVLETKPLMEKGRLCKE